MPIMRTLDGNAVITRRAGLGLAALALAGGLGLGLPTRPALAQAKPALVFAAASLKNALDEIARQYEKETGKKVTISYGASSALAKQIEAAAPTDLFISADLDWMDYLVGRKRIRADSRVNLVGNRLVLVAPAAAAGGSTDRGGPSCSGSVRPRTPSGPRGPGSAGRRSWSSATMGPRHRSAASRGGRPPGRSTPVPRGTGRWRSHSVPGSAGRKSGGLRVPSRAWRRSPARTGLG